MRIYNKISKSGIFCDKRFEHFTLMNLISDGWFNDYLHLGETAFDVRFYGANTRVDVADYEDGIVRLIAYVGSVEVGRMLVSRNDFINNVKFLLTRGN